jgi:predicted phosphodiesterase
MIWTPEVLKILQARINNGESYKDIAPSFNSTATAIEGAVRRYSLQGMRKIESSKIIIPKIPERVNLEGCEEVNFEELKKAAKLQWAISKTKVPANKKKAFKAFVVVGDHHVPEHDKAAHKAIFNLMDDYKFDGIIEIGDFLDLSCISHWNKGKNRILEGKRLKNDYIAGNAVLDEFDKRLPAGAEKHFFKGNHELWVDQLIDETPALEGLFDIESALKLKERGYKVYAYNEIVSFGRLKITHGIYAGANPAKTHVMKTLSNILVGHCHSPEMVLVHSPAKEVSVVGYVNGCLCGMAPEYMKNKPSNWAVGFAILYLFPEGAFDVTLIRMVKSRFVFNGKVYSGV